MGKALAGKTALIMGGAGGIGGAAARALLADGASITLFSRDETKLAAFAAELTPQTSADATVSYVAGDAQCEPDVEAAVAHASHDGALDICVSTVGRGHTVPLLLNDADRFTDELRVNITTAFIAIKYCVPAMVEAGGGSLVFTSSVIARQSYPYMSGYCAGKAGLEGLVRAAADEIGHLGVRINCVRPGLVRAPGNPKTGALFEGDREQLFLEQTPLGRTGTPHDIGAAIRYLAGPESGWVTGTSLNIDGGAHLRRSPDMTSLLRDTLGNPTVDSLLAGRIPQRR
ncbi:SDR family oxidoreductase [Nocardia sp. NPDC046763]|uniref:SDR family NAD(P)-dependent oxidoreductase n=1 Tax=Nocardia sp. NPDC046763 TaxID=3155256 RepID=UPI0033FD0448